MFCVNSDVLARCPHGIGATNVRSIAITKPGTSEGSTVDLDYERVFDQQTSHACALCIPTHAHVYMTGLVPVFAI